MGYPERGLVTKSDDSDTISVIRKFSQDKEVCNVFGPVVGDSKFVDAEELGILHYIASADPNVG
jgi:hypothetical protein